MNLPNAITLSRIPMMFVIAGLLYPGWAGAPSIAFVLFIASAIGDGVDGYLARSRGIVSSFGKLMDPLTDKVMVLGLAVVFVERRELAAALVLITLCREFLVTGIRTVAASKGVVVAADPGGKLKTVVQLTALGFLLGAAMVAGDWVRFLPWNLDSFVAFLRAAGAWLFSLATVLAVISGVRYAVKYRAVLLAEAL